ncbi:DUF397 domain-containing protein [Actinomadura algeriensis]|uniref:DUF397 domain-containing protein n=1 Tax=Actinomadura algeriensis TaxID=1679523 RepID=A0ABR9JZT7_9ACTN|nr:DUF397 domain-containing protein [Actinomadura algeriensis]MBE1536089.1 hypothetical protein [Actinomadura algeriensis]
MSKQDRNAVRWRTSSYSNAQGTQCVEVAPLGSTVLARDSTDPAGPVLGFSRAEWGVFLDEVKRGVLDH